MDFVGGHASGEKVILFLAFFKSPLLTAISGCDAFSSLVLKLRNDAYLAEHFDPRPWQLPLHLFLSCTPIAILQTKRLFSSHISRLPLLQVNYSFLYRLLTGC
jgi:hypothetical protein